MENSFTKETLDNEIIRDFYSGLSISDISKKFKSVICSIDDSSNSLTDSRKYVSYVIYNYQIKKN